MLQYASSSNSTSTLLGLIDLSPQTTSLDVGLIGGSTADAKVSRKRKAEPPAAATTPEPRLRSNRRRSTDEVDASLSLVSSAPVRAGRTPSDAVEQLSPVSASGSLTYGAPLAASASAPSCCGPPPPQYSPAYCFAVPPPASCCPPPPPTPFPLEAEPARRWQMDAQTAYTPPTPFRAVQRTDSAEGDAPPVKSCCSARAAPAPPVALPPLPLPLHLDVSLQPSPLLPILTLVNNGLPSNPAPAPAPPAAAKPVTHHTAGGSCCQPKLGGGAPPAKLPFRASHRLTY